MFNEETLHKYPALIRAFTGIQAEKFWDMLEKMEAKLPGYETERHTRNDRKRAVGAGRKFDQSLAQRTVSVLSYLRLHVPQLVIALMFGLTQSDISRDLRRLLPLIIDVLPCPEVWEITP
ncbi:MAG: transposase family protein [Methylobacter sp.]